MPAATSKQELIAANEREWRKLHALMETLDEDAAVRPDSDGYTAKRLIGHRAAWIDLYFDWCAAAQRGKPLEMPAPRVQVEPASGAQRTDLRTTTGLVVVGHLCSA